MHATEPERFSRLCREGLAALDHILEHKPDHVHDEIAGATRCIVQVRDALIAARRRGAPAGEGELLGHVNSLLSVLIAAEFPLAGVRWQRVKQARDEYEHVLARLPDRR